MTPTKSHQQERDEDRDDLITMKSDIKYLIKAVDGLDQKVSKNYVTVDQFDPIKRLVYGTVMVVGASLGAAIMALLFK